MASITLIRIGSTFPLFHIFFTLFLANPFNIHLTILFHFHHALLLSIALQSIRFARSPALFNLFRSVRIKFWIIHSLLSLSFCRICPTFQFTDREAYLFATYSSVTFASVTFASVTLWSRTLAQNTHKQWPTFVGVACISPIFRSTLADHLVRHNHFFIYFWHISFIFFIFSSHLEWNHEKITFLIKLIAHLLLRLFSSFSHFLPFGSFSVRF